MNDEIGPRPVPGRYVSTHGEKCWVLIGREATDTNDGSVRIEFDNGTFSSAFFRTFKNWRYRRLPEDEQ